MRFLKGIFLLFCAVTAVADNEVSLELGRYPGSIELATYNADSAVVNFLTSVNSIQDTQNWGQERVFGHNSLKVYTLPLSSSETTDQVIHAFTSVLNERGAEIVFSCAGEHGGCGFFMPRKIASSGKRKEVLSKINNFWNLNDGDFRLVTARLVEGEDRYYVSVLVSQMDVERPIQYLVDISREQKPLRVALESSENRVQAKMDKSGRAVLDLVTFESGSATINPQSHQYLSELGSYLGSNAGESFYLVGHTDNVGDKAYNLRLSNARARSVLQVILQMGLGDIDVKVLGRGGREPIASNDNPQGRKKNRRVELINARVIDGTL